MLGRGFGVLPSPAGLVPPAEEGVVPSVAVAEAQCQGGQQEQEDDKEGDQHGLVAWQGKHRDQ